MRYLNRNQIYAICTVSSLILLIAGCFLHKYSIVSTVLIGLGCSGVTASIMAFLIEIKDSQERKRVREVYFKKLFNEIVLFLQRVLWFDERLSDSSFNWDMPPKEYSRLPYILFAFGNYPHPDISWDEFTNRIKECKEKYDLDKLNEYNEPTVSSITKMFTIISASSSGLTSSLSRICMNDVILASNNYISLDDIEDMRFNITIAVGYMSKPNKNYGLFIGMVFSEMEKLMKLCNYDPPKTTIVLRGSAHISEL